MGTTGGRMVLSAVALLATLIAGCARSGPLRQVSLTRVDPTVTAPRVEQPQVAPLRVAVASVLSPQETVKNYAAFFDLLGRRIGRPVEMIQRRTYQETYDLLRFGSAELGLVCTYVYVKGEAAFGLELVAAPEVNGKAEYRSLIIVLADSGLESFADLTGKRFAFSDPLSNSGYIYPLGLLRVMGKEPGGFFRSTEYTYSHDNSIRAVLQGVVDGAAVDSLVFDQWLSKNPRARDRLRVINTSPPFASPPFVAGPGAAPELRRQVQEALLRLHLEPEGQAAMKILGVDRFVTIQDGDYQSVRENARRAGVEP